MKVLEKLDNILIFLKETKPSFFLTVALFIIGMVVPGACGLAIYDINLFEEIDMFRLILLSIGISSPAILVSLLLNLDPNTSYPDNNSVERIFLLSGFISISTLTIIASLNYNLTWFFNISVPIEGFYLLFIFLVIVYAIIISSIKKIKYKRKQKYKAQSNKKPTRTTKQNS